MEHTSTDLKLMYNQRLNHLTQTLSTLYSQISTEKSLIFLQSHPDLLKYQTDRIAELVKEIINDQRETILISCLEDYHKLKQEVQTSQLHPNSENPNILSKEIANQFKQKLISQSDENNLQRNQQKQLVQQNQKAKQVSNLPNKSILSNQNFNNYEIQRNSLQSIIASLTQQNKRLVDDLDRYREQIKDERSQFTKKQQKLTKQAQQIQSLLNLARTDLENKTVQIFKLQKQLRETQEDSLSQKIYISDKYSYLARNKSTQSFRPSYSNNSQQLFPKSKFRVAEFQQMCYQISKQQQQLKGIRFNFAKFGQVLQKGVKSQLHNLRKTIISMRTGIQSFVKDSKQQMHKFCQLFSGKAYKIMSQQKMNHSEKIEHIKNLYQQQMILIEEKRKLQKDQEKNMINETEVKIRDERILQLQEQMQNIRYLQNQYRELLVTNQQLKAKMESMNHEPVRQSKNQLSKQTSQLFVKIPQQYVKNPSILNNSKSLSPKTVSKILNPVSPSHYKSPTNFNKLKLEESGIHYNPELLFDQPIKDSHSRKELETGFNELEQQIQAIIERRNKRNARNNFRYE